MSNAVDQMEIKQIQIDINDDVVMPEDRGIIVGEIFTNNYDTGGEMLQGHVSTLLLCFTTQLRLHLNL